jgi:hypothetical protein
MVVNMGHFPPLTCSEKKQGKVLVPGSSSSQKVISSLDSSCLHDVKYVPSILIGFNGSIIKHMAITSDEVIMTSVLDGVEAMSSLVKTPCSRI